MKNPITWYFIKVFTFWHIQNQVSLIVLLTAQTFVSPFVGRAGSGQINNK